MEWNALLDELDHKARKLKQRMERLEKENEELRQSVFSYLQQMEQQARTLRSLEQQHNAQTLASTLPAPERKALRKEIDRHLALIDRCVAQFNAGLIGDTAQPFLKK